MRRLATAIIGASGLCATACATVDMRAPTALSSATPVEIALAEAVDDLSASVIAAGWTPRAEDRASAAAAAFKLLVHGVGADRAAKDEAKDDPVDAYVSTLEPGDAPATIAGDVDRLHARLAKVNAAALDVANAGILAQALSDDVLRLEAAFDETRRARAFLASAAERTKAGEADAVKSSFVALDDEMQRTSALADALAAQARPAPGVG